MNPMTNRVLRHPLFLAAAAVAVMFGVAAALTQLIESDLSHQSRLINVSCRGPLGNGPESALLAFVISERPQLVVVRGRGWSKASPNAPEVAHEVRLRVVRNADGTDLGRNESWLAPENKRLRDDLKHLAPGDPKHCACVLTLPPGGYSALIEDRTGRPGLGGIEVFVIQK